MFLCVFISNFKSQYNVSQDFNPGSIKTSAEIPYTRQWLNNRYFDDNSSWIASKEGDGSDVDASISDGFGNYYINGNSGVLRIDDPLNNTDWTAIKNPNLPILPDVYEINSSGCYVSHLWDEDINQTRNRPSVRWQQTITMPVDMRDYIITSASLVVIFNATVTVAPWWNGGIDREGDTGLDAYSTGDYAEFYVLLSDLEETFPPVQVAYNNTGNLGRDNPPLGSYPDTPMVVVPEDALKGILSSILETDGIHFKITLGIDIYCEDNEIGVDIDRWNSLIIRSFNLTFSYEKKIDQYTTVSWEQAGGEISGENTEITNGFLNFEYKINKTWPSSAENSEIRVFINDKQVTGPPIKLSGAKDTLQEAYPGRMDVTSFLSKNISITLKIQIYLADEFGLSEKIKISIDNVDFRISYVVFTNDIFREPWFFRLLLIIASIAGLGIGGYFFAYQRVLKYPKPVRKVRKFRRTLNKKKEPTTFVVDREKAFKKEYDNELNKSSSFLKGKPTEEPTSIKTPTLAKQLPTTEKLPESNKDMEAS